MNRTQLAKQVALWAVVATVLSAATQYHEPYRLQFHFTPPQNWTNDPNGLVYYKGEYHLFYQHNPFGPKWGHMSWGHSVSTDLVHWKPLPVAIPEENGIMIFSGSAVVDEHNSSGLCKNPDPQDQSCLIAIYAGHTETLQTQNIAFSNDQGRTWTKYKGNPVIDLHLKDFRDPKVLWHEPTKKWIMVTAVAQEKKIRFFSSPDLIHWEQLTDFGPQGATAGVWECPDLFELPVGNSAEKRWVLIVNLNPGGIAGGSGGQYFVGNFDGKAFTNENTPDTQLWLDYGKDYYATISFFGGPPKDSRRIMLGWYSNWLYANDTPETTWRGAMAMPRTVTLQKTNAGIRLRQMPVREFDTLASPVYQLRNLTVEQVNARLQSDELRGNVLEIEAEFTPGTAKEFGVSVLKGHTEQTIIGVSPAESKVFIDRTKSGDVSFNKNFSSRDAGPVTIGATVKLRIYVDWSGVEVFANDGETTLAERVFPSPDSRGVSLFTNGGEAKVKSLKISRLKSIWP